MVYLPERLLQMGLLPEKVAGCALHYLQRQVQKVSLPLCLMLSMYGSLLQLAPAENESFDNDKLRKQ
jgi:hypothetical protein